MSSPEQDGTQGSGSGDLRPGEKPIGFRVARGAVSSVVRKIIVAPISLVLVPFTLHKVGVSGYGTWAILVTIINLSWIMDPGLSPTVTKFVAEHSGTGDIAEVRRLLDAACALCMLISAVALGLLAFFSHAIIKQLFRGPDAPPLSEILTLWPLVLMTIAAGLMTTPFLSVMNGRQRMDLTNILVFSSELFSALLTVVFLLVGAKVGGLLLARLLSSLFILFGSALIARRLLPVMPNPLRCEFAAVRKICKFGLALSSGYITSTLQGQLERLYLARFVGVVSVGWYNVASEGAAKVQRIPDLLLRPVLAAASELDAAKERRKVEELHFRTHKYLALTAVPLVVFAIATARMLIGLWVGNNLAIIALPFALLVVGNFFSQIAVPTYFVSVGRGILRPAVYSALLAGVLNVVLSFIFITRWGFSGAVMGTVLPMIISTIYFFVACQPYFETSFFTMLRRAYLKPLLCSVAAALVIPAISLLGLRAWQNLALMVGAYGAVYLAGLAVTHFFDSFDFAKAEGHLPFMKLARRLAPTS